MDSITRDVNFCFLYNDDVLLLSRHQEKHLQHLQILFKRLYAHSDVALRSTWKNMSIQASIIIFMTLEWPGRHF